MHHHFSFISLIRFELVDRQFSIQVLFLLNYPFLLFLKMIFRSFAQLRDLAGWISAALYRVLPSFISELSFNSGAGRGQQPAADGAGPTQERRPGRRRWHRYVFFIKNSI